MDIAEKTLQLKQDFDEVYEAGKKAEYDMFWDNFQNYGQRLYYPMGFIYWGNEYIRPKYKVTFVMSNSVNQYEIFRNCTNLKKIEKEYFDFSQYETSPTQDTRGWYYQFADCPSLEYFEDLGCQPGFYYYTWQNDTNLHTIEVMRITEDCIIYSPFKNCLNLRNVTIEGVIGYEFNVSYCPQLTIESLKSIITHLKDYSGTEQEFTKPIILSIASKNLLNAEGATSPNGNTWAQYVSDLGWNLK